MRRTSWLILTLAIGSLVNAQESSSFPPAPTVVPRLINFSGKATDVRGKAMSGTTGATFAIYSEQSGSAPLWVETQSVKADLRGRFVAQLGSTKPDGLPLDLFTSGEARWLGVRINGGEEQPRVMLLSVPYALKAGDAATIGGLPPSAFVLAPPPVAVAPVAEGTTSYSASAPSASSNVTTSGGGVNTLTLFTTATNVQSSAITQLGAGAKAQIGINTTTPTTTLDVHGGAAVRGTLVLPAAGLATAAVGTASQPINMTVSTFDKGSSSAVGQTFQLKAEPANNNTATPGATFNLLFRHGTNLPAETGFSIGQNGIVSFKSGQTFPGTGTITGVIAGKGLTDGGTTGNVTLNLDLAQVPLLASGNTFTGNQTVNGNLSATGALTGSAFQIGSDLFSFGSLANGNSFLGFAGNTTTTGSSNIAVGAGSLSGNTSGGSNVAVGYQALPVNTTGSLNVALGHYTLYQNLGGNANTAAGNAALFFNTNGNNNAAYGSGALGFNTSGSQNTAVGVSALVNNTTGSGNTAVGANALPQSSASLNTGVGLGALSALALGMGNTAVGYNSGLNDQQGTHNTYLGDSAGTSANVALSNATALGANSLVSESNALILGDNASVGIGTPAPYLDYGLTIDTTSSSRITGGVVVNATTGNLYLGMIQGVHKFRVDISGTVWADGGFNASGADFAESVAVRGPRSEYEPGDVLEIDRSAHRGLTLSHHPYATLVAGIYSTKPGVLASPYHIDDTIAKDSEVPLAVIGIVPCKVTSENGFIAPGDLLVTSSRAGYAMKGTNRRRMMGAVVGKALEPLAKRTGVIEVLVTLQ